VFLNPETFDRVKGLCGLDCGRVQYVSAPAYDPHTGCVVFAAESAERGEDGPARSELVAVSADFRVMAREPRRAIRIGEDGRAERFAYPALKSA
jgi:hypothetical protein